MTPNRGRSNKNITENRNSVPSSRLLTGFPIDVYIHVCVCVCVEFDLLEIGNYRIVLFEENSSSLIIG